MDLKTVVNHLVNGSLSRELCLICLLPLGNYSENVFSRVCKKDMEFSVAQILEEVCIIKLSSTDHYNVCQSCFTNATAAYRFHLKAKQSHEILNFYVNELLKNVYYMCIPESIDTDDSLCFSLPMYKSTINIDLKKENNQTISNLDIKTDKDAYNSDEIVIKHADGKFDSYQVTQNDNLRLVNENIKDSDGDVHIKRRKTRLPMTYKTCSKCPVKYRFGAKLKEHMKVVHDIDLYICKVCKEVIEGELEFSNHLRMHTDIHTCDICSTVFKKRETIITHLKWHEETKNMIKKKNARVCEKCGFIVADMASLMEHYSKKHDRNYSCRYCGKMYRGETSLNSHLKKHEMYMRMDEKHKKLDNKTWELSIQNINKSNSFPCDTCGKMFASERSLLWHSRLHTNERPYKCSECGRGFVSVNRRNQHTICAHTMPTLRCPLCPALFHLKSMITTHIKKVHLKQHKRRNRTSKHHNVSWRTETVPIRELSMSIQAPLKNIVKMEPQWQ